MRRFLVTFLIFLGISTLNEARARAYAQWQFTSGAARCSQCHYGPAGTGLITSYGRDAVGEELSTFAGNGALLHGIAVPPQWLAVGGDLRGALMARDVQDPDGATYAAFPMQADFLARIAFGAGISFYGTLGFRGQTRAPDTAVPAQNFQPATATRLISREHYLMWQPEVLGPYARAGRFFAPFGLRLAEHVTYVRRDLGFNQLEETYNVSGGFVYPHSELHVAAFTSDFVRHIGSQEKGLSAYYEHRLLDDSAAVAAQGRLAFGPGYTRLILGTVGKVFIEKARTMLLTEIDAVQMEFEGSAAGARQQLVAAGGIAVLPVRGLMATFLIERNQVDLQIRGAGWTAGTLLLNWFPYAHVELQVMSRLQSPGGADTAKTLLAQLHYFL
ncbi:MAG: hypothetical protein ABUL67_00835 [Haliangium ochraceum]